MIVYIAGPMSGIEGNNRDTFARAAKRLREHCPNCGSKVGEAVQP